MKIDSGPETVLNDAARVEHLVAGEPNPGRGKVMNSINRLSRMPKRRICVLLLACCGIAHGQDVAEQPIATEETSRDAEALDVIVVTAERRDEPLQTTPISATVIAGEDLAKLGVNVVDQLQFATPSATINNFGQGIDFNIRGIGKAEHNTQTTTGVITYRDGVATFPGYFTAEPYYDVSSVEILRGPQGTFVGQNATGGAVFVTSNDPVIDDGYGGYWLGQVGNYSDIGGQGAINLPISETLAARVAFNGENRDSFWDISGPYTGNDARLRSRSVRAGLLWEPNSALSVLFKTDYSYLDMGAYPADPVSATNDPFELTANADLHARDRFGRSVLRVDYAFDGGTTFRSVTGYQAGNTAYRADLDGTSAGNSIFRDSVDEEILSQEFNLISADTGAMNWILGAYFQKDEYTFLPDAFVVGVPPGNPATEYVLDGTNPKQTSAVFGQMGFALSERLELQVGGRYSRSRTSNDIAIRQYGTPLASVQTARYANFSGKLALNWAATDDQFLYAFAATGYRPGGLNVNVGLGLPDPFDEEIVTSYEAGWKSNWMGGRVRTQLSVFHNTYENFQVTIGNPEIPVFGLELNAQDKTNINGIEWQVQAVHGNWQVDAGFGLMRSKLGTFFATDPRAASLTPCDPRSGPVSTTCLALKGRDQTYAPDFTFNVGLQYDFSVGQGTITPRINFGHISSQWATLFQNEARGDRIEARDVVSGQIAWQTGDYLVSLYATNLTDETYVAAINTGLRFVGPPRQFGVRVMKQF
jgi:iron complex outermembrane receptor protein